MQPPTNGVLLDLSWPQDEPWMEANPDFQIQDPEKPEKFQVAYHFKALVGLVNLTISEIWNSRFRIPKIRKNWKTGKISSGIFITFD